MLRMRLGKNKRTLWIELKDFNEFKQNFLKKVEVAQKDINPKISENLLLKLATNNIYSH